MHGITNISVVFTTGFYCAICNILEVLCGIYIHISIVFTTGICCTVYNIPVIFVW